MKTLLFIITCVTTAFIGNLALALDETILSRHGEWTVAVNVDSSGDLFCDTYATNRNGMVQVAVYGDGELFLSFNLADMSGPKEAEAISLLVTINGTDWNLDNAYIEEGREANRAFVQFYFKENEGGELINDMMLGYELRIPMGRGTSDYVWSLNGSFDAFAALNECQEKLAPSY